MTTDMSQASQLINVMVFRAALSMCRKLVVYAEPDKWFGEKGFVVSVMSFKMREHL